jgi:hypothetical protein
MNQSSNDSRTIFSSSTISTFHLPLINSFLQKWRVQREYKDQL